MCVANMDLITVWGIELDSISVMGSKLNWFMSVGRKIPGFSVWIFY